MPKWLNPVREVLDNSAESIRIFFRDDDAGWANHQLYLLLDVFAQAQVPLDLAVIPDALTQNLTEELLSRWRQNQELLGLHQHGFSHTNHEVFGRKCEFGISRTKPQQKADIEKGQKYLQTVLGEAFDAHFTPPWNRCTQETVEVLNELGFQLLSRNATAAELQPSPLQQISVNIDWSKILKTSSNALTALGQAVSDNLKTNCLTGIMLHHADMETIHLQPLAELLALISDHDKAQGVLLREALG